jgi:phytoene synthase
MGHGMPEALAYCEKFLREEDKDRYLASLFAPADARPALFSLYAFDLETARVALRVREPLAGEIRLQWWHDALTGQIPDQAAGNPVAAAFLETRQRRDLPLDQVLAVIEARRTRLYEEPLAGLDVLGDFSRKTAGAIFSLAARILKGGADPQADRLGEAAALAMVVDAEGGTHSYADNVLSAARSSLAQAHDLIGSVSDRVLPAFLPLALVNARLALMERKASPDIPQWRKQWILWRASKNLARHLSS